MKRRTRIELFTEEQPLLRPLPRHPYDTARVLYRVCDLEGFIAWESNWYSLPFEHVTEILPVRITENELIVYTADLSCIARHALLPRGAQQRSVLDGHRPRLADRGPDLEQLRAAFAGLDEKAAAFLAALEKAQPRSAGYHARQVLALRGRWTTDDLVAALEHALFSALPKRPTSALQKRPTPSWPSSRDRLGSVKRVATLLIKPSIAASWNRCAFSLWRAPRPPRATLRVTPA